MEAWLDGLFLLPQFLIAFVLAAAMTEVLPRANAHWLVLCGIVLWGSFSLLLDNGVALLITTLWPDGEVFDLARLYWHGAAAETVGALFGEMFTLTSRLWRDESA